MNTILEQFNRIIERYRNGEFGSKHLTLAEILKEADAKDLLNQMSSSDMQYLIDNSSGMTKLMYIKLKEEKTNEESNYDNIRPKVLYKINKNNVNKSKK